MITAAGIDGRPDRFGNTLGGRFHQAIYFDDGDITAIACSQPLADGQGSGGGEIHFP